MEIFIAPLRENIEGMLANDKKLTEIAQFGAEKARKNAQKTLAEVREIIGFSKFYM